MCVDSRVANHTMHNFVSKNYDMKVDRILNEYTNSPPPRPIYAHYWIYNGSKQIDQSLTKHKAYWVPF